MVTWLVLLLVGPGFACNMFTDYCDNMEAGRVVREAGPGRVVREAGPSRVGAVKQVRLQDYCFKKLLLTLGLLYQVTETLDSLFGGSYNKQLRPGIGVRPTEVRRTTAY